MREAINTTINQPCKRVSIGGDFCPPRGAARSSLVPRDLTAELCLIALASLGHVRLAFWSVFVKQLSVPCLLRLCLV